MANVMAGDTQTTPVNETPALVLVDSDSAERSNSGEIDLTEDSSETRVPEKSDRAMTGLKVLVVDDNKVNRRVARLFLEPLGATTTEAENGQEALDLLSRESFNLVRRFRHMPVMDGREAISKIRQSKKDWSNIPVIALTADAMAGDREKCLSLGIDGYVAKPVDQRELLTEILTVRAEAEKNRRALAPDFNETRVREHQDHAADKILSEPVDIDRQDTPEVA